jgi:transposase
MSNQGITNRYSHAFKQKVVSEIENGTLSISQAQRVYGIAGGATVQTWLRQLGKAHLLNKVIHIQMTDEPDKMQALAKEKRALESALAQAHLRIITLENTVKVLEEESGLLKKSTSTRSSKLVSGTTDSTPEATR